jgi:CHAT domain-containing protein
LAARHNQNLKGTTMKKLLDFDVAIEPYGDGYRTRVVASPAGQAHADFALPLSDTDLENFVLKVGMSIGRTRRKARRIESQERRLLEEFGGQLYRAMFSGSVQQCLDRSLLTAQSKGAGLRIRLRLPGALANIPWEYLHDEEHGFLGLSPQTALVRYLEMPKPAQPFPISPPLRILAMISAPSDVSELHGEEEWDKLNDALSDLVRQGMVQVDRTEAGTLAALQGPLRRSDYHVLHFVGHGGYDEQAQDGALALEGADRKTRLATGRDLWVMLQAHSSLRLVVLNACEGARSARDDPFGGVAQALVRLGVPAVIAMQFEISDPAALVFSQSFYQAIADGLPVDEATVEARIALFAAGNEVEWATPVLYLRSPDGRVFTRSQPSETQRKAKQDADRKAREDADRKAREDADRKAREEAELRVLEERARSAGEAGDAAGANSAPSQTDAGPDAGPAVLPGDATSFRSRLLRLLRRTRLASPAGILLLLLLVVAVIVVVLVIPGTTSQPLTGTSMGTGTLNLTTGAETVTFTGDFSPQGAFTGHANLIVTSTRGAAGTFSYTGTSTEVTADGDQVFSKITGSGTYTSTGSQGTLTDTITGGTGRFTGASGTYTETFSTDVTSTTATTETFNFTGTAHGNISY